LGLPQSLEAVDQSSDLAQGNGNGDRHDSFFLHMITIVTVIILIVGLVNFRRNQKKIKRCLLRPNSN
jgi:hypothetical protein